MIPKQVRNDTLLRYVRLTILIPDKRNCKRFLLFLSYTLKKAFSFRYGMIFILIYLRQQSFQAYGVMQ